MLYLKRKKVAYGKRKKWVLYPISNNKNRIKMRPDTVLESFPLYCP